LSEKIIKAGADISMVWKTTIFMENVGMDILYWLWWIAVLAILLWLYWMVKDYLER